MDDQGNMGSQGGQGDAGQPQASSNQPVVQPQTPAQQAPAVGSVNKETGPIGSYDIAEVVKPTDAEPIIEDKEVADAGVEPVTEVPKLTPEHKKVGIELSHQIAPVNMSPTVVIKAPITEEEAKSILKLHKKISNSIVWLATEFLRQLSIVRKEKI